MAEGTDVADVPAPEVTEPVAELMHGVPVATSLGDAVLHPDRADLSGLVRTLRDEHGYAMCLDVCGVDYLTYDADRNLPDSVEPQRFEVVVTLISHAEQSRLRLRVQVPADDPTCPSLFDVHPGTEAMEREAFDLLGISFDGHPDLTRILMPESWEGYPLRKDEAIGRIPVQFKDANRRDQR